MSRFLAIYVIAPATSSALFFSKREFLIMQDSTADSVDVAIAPPDPAEQFINIHESITTPLASKWIAPPRWVVYPSLNLIFLIVLPLALDSMIKILDLPPPSSKTPSDEIMFNFLSIVIAFPSDLNFPDNLIVSPFSALSTKSWISENLPLFKSKTELTTPPLPLFEFWESLSPLSLPDFISDNFSSFE